MQLVDVYIYNSAQQLNKPFTYQITNDFDKVTIGQFVIINFNNTLKIAIIVNKYLKDQTDFPVKEVVMVVEERMLNKFQLAFLSYIDQNLYGTFSSKLNLFLNNANKLIIDALIYVGNEEIYLSQLKGDARRELIKKINNEEVDARIFYDFKIKNQKEQYVIVNEKFNIIQNDNELKSETNDELKPIKLTAKQQLVLDFVQQAKIIKISTVVNQLQISKSVISNLVKKQILTIVEKEKVFDYMFDLQTPSDYQLNVDQTIAVQKIKNEPLKPTLLHGVPSSGKTIVYAQIIKLILAKNNQSLVVIPNNALAIQMTNVLQKIFGEIVLFYNDDSTQLEKINNNKAIENGTVKIVVGTKNALFAPFSKLKLVVIDEEHDQVYKNKGKIKYGVHDFIEFFNKNKIKVILGSATPKIESYARAQKAVYQLVELPTRYQNYQMPKVSFDNSKITTEISQSLEKLIVNNKKSNLPTLILFNKTGFANQVHCLDCGYVVTCPNCKTYLNYSKQRSQYKCKVCGLSQVAKNSCDNCQSHNLSTIGIGIEQFIELLTKQFGNYKIAQLTGEKQVDEMYETLKQFNENEIDILVGTQIISAGLDFMSIKNAYIANLDSLLFLDEVKASEIAFSLIEQVAGRCGRNIDQSSIIIQTEYEHHPVMEAVLNHDYQLFYHNELENRHLLQTIPFYNICKIELKASNEYLLKNIAKQFMKKLINEKLDVKLIDNPMINKIGNEYRLYFVVKYKREQILAIIKKHQKILIDNKINITVDLTIDQIGY